MAARFALAKKELRKKLKEALRNMTIEQRKTESGNIVKQLLASDRYRSSERVSVYLSTSEEVDTTGIVEDIFSSGKRCFIPHVEGSNMTMLRVLSMDDLHSLSHQQWGITQPATTADRENALLTGGLDLIIVPGMGFTAQGHRLGRGKGYYDRYLTHCKMTGFTPTTIGLSFSTQLCEDIPMADNDIQLDCVLFPTTSK